MNISVSVQENGANITALAEKIQAGLPAALLAGAEAVADAARGMCPVDTGRLQGSISASASGEHATVSVGADYGIYVEFGTYKMAARPFLAPALSVATDAVLAAVSGGIAG